MRYSLSRRPPAPALALRGCTGLNSKPGAPIIPRRRRCRRPKPPPPGNRRLPPSGALVLPPSPHPRRDQAPTPARPTAFPGPDLRRPGPIHACSTSCLPSMRSARCTSRSSCWIREPPSATRRWPAARREARSSAPTCSSPPPGAVGDSPTSTAPAVRLRWPERAPRAWIRRGPSLSTSSPRPRSWR